MPKSLRGHCFSWVNPEKWNSSAQLKSACLMLHKTSKLFSKMTVIFDIFSNEFSVVAILTNAKLSYSCRWQVPSFLLYNLHFLNSNVSEVSSCSHLPLCICIEKVSIQIFHWFFLLAIFLFFTYFIGLLILFIRVVYLKYESKC